MVQMDTTAKHQHSGQDVKTDGLDRKGSDRDQAASRQYEQGKWLLLESGMEASHS
jgi:hypothetical protein